MLSFFTDNFVERFVNSDIITTETALFRMLVSLLLGMTIGLERQTRRRDAGMRTFTLICMGSTLAMIVSIWIPQSFPNFLNGDPGRISAQVISGIGFLGAGAIIHSGVSAHGLTTAACIWMIAIIGLTVGAGLFVPSVIATCCAMFVLVTMEHLEKKMFLNGVNKILVIRCKTVTPDDPFIRSKLESAKMAVLSQSFEYDYDSQTSILTYKVNVRARYAYSDLFSDINSLGYISSISLQA